MKMLFVIAELVGIVCFVTAILDLGMNGRYADWAPVGIGAAVICATAMYFLGGR